MSNKAGLQLTSVAMLFLVATSTLAQSSGWAKFGGMLGGNAQRKQQIYDDETARLYERDGALARAYNLQTEARIREHLFALWQSGGVPENEARSIVGSYQFNPSWEAFLGSVRRTGSHQGFKDTWDAYRRRDYVLANDLLLSSSIVEQEELKAKASSSANNDEILRGRAEIDALGIKLEATDPAYQEKLDYLEPKLKKIIEIYPPSEWAARFERAFFEVRL